MTTNEIIAECELSCAEYRLWKLREDGWTLREIVRILADEHQQALEDHNRERQVQGRLPVTVRPMALATVCRHLQDIDSQIFAAKIKAIHGRVSVRVTVAKGHEAYSLVDVTLADALRRLSMARRRK